MIKRSVFAIGLLASSAAIAADNNFFYLGGSLGQARTSFDGNPAVAGGLATTYDNSVSAWSAFGGYQINKYFGAELRYIKFGDTNVQVNVPGVGSLFTNIQINGWGASLVGTQPLGKDFSLLGRIGATYTRETRGNCNICAGPVSSSSDNVWSPSFGIGLQYDFNASLIARGEVERFTKIGDSDNTFGGRATLWTAAMAYKF
jgi:OOP family OmpA-OmpF porin